MKIKLLIVLISLCLATPCFAFPLELIWDKVTTDVAGNPLSSPPKYRIYRKTSLENFKPIAETWNTRWTWLAPSIGHSVYRVTAFNDAGESEPSNELKIVVDRCPRTEP